MEINLTNKCRICLSEEQEMHYLFMEFDQGMTLQEILTTTTGFEIHPDDGLSTYLCQNCTSVIVDFYNLLTIYKENEKQIKTLLNDVESNLDQVVVFKSDENTNNFEETDAGNGEEEQEMAPAEEDDYITIKVEEPQEEMSEDEEENCKDEPEDNKYGLTGEETAHFSPENEEADFQFEYQEINTYTCPECGECFLYKNDIQEHLAAKHDITEVDYEELSEVSLLKVKRVNEKAPCANKCNICHHSFATIETFKRHLETHKTNICDVCGAGFIKKSYLKDHQEIHSSERKHVCNFCNKAFKRRTVLVKHRKIHTHPRECVCELCGKAFNDKGTLKTHIMLLHVKERNYICLICGVKFPLKATLEKHIRRHQNKQREFFCTQCPLGYRDKSSLDRHIFVKHSGQSVKATCDKCGKQYTTASSLMKHKKVAHSNNTLTLQLVEDRN